LWSWLEDNASVYVTADFPPDPLLFQQQSELATAWVDECQQQHEHCPRPKLVLLPPRVLDVSLQSDTKRLCLHTSKEGETGKYAALSYCWGGPQKFMTTTANLDIYTQSIQEDDLPQTLFDAIRFTRALGLQYLWVDSLCIVQDSTEDKERQIPLMGDIYHNSHVAITASFARTIEDGFLKRFPTMTYSQIPKTSPERERSRMTHYIQENFNITAHSGEKDFIDELFKTGWTSPIPISSLQHDLTGLTYYSEGFSPDHDPLFQRAWTLQERLLSPHLLLFSRAGLGWHCQSKKQCDPEIQGGICGDTTQRLPPESFLDNVPPPESEIDHRKAYESWISVANDYSRGLLTKEDDKMVAIAGIAQRYGERFRQQLGVYHAGLWEIFLIEGLRWYVPPARIFAHIPEIFRALTWSWASVDGAFLCEVPDIDHLLAESLGCVIFLREDYM
jgi:hypothetical protein